MHASKRKLHQAPALRSFASAEKVWDYKIKGAAEGGSIPRRSEPTRIEVPATPASRGLPLWAKDLVVTVITALGMFGVLLYFAGWLAAIIAMVCLIGILGIVAYSSLDVRADWKF